MARTKKQAGGQTKFQQAYSKLTPAQKQSDTMKMYLANRGGRKASGKPSLATNTGEPTNVRTKRPGGFATGGRARLAATEPLGTVRPKPKPKKQRGYGQAQEGRGGYSKGGSVSARLSKAGPVAKPN